MSSGQLRMIINTRERAVSSDIDRIGAFLGAGPAFEMQRLHNDQRLDWYQYSGAVQPANAVAAPLSADVYGGLMVDPQTTSLLVTPGSLGCFFPDPNATTDDSPYLLINDPGVTSTGALTFTPNGGGGVRVDLVECTPVDTLLESASRDLYDPSSALGFTFANVEKVRAFRLQYRLRLGSPGQGVPALAQGWLPLAAVVVTNSATSFAQCDVYDVRPLIVDRARPQPIGASNCPVTVAEFGTSSIVAHAPGVTAIGGYSFNTFGGYSAGGVLRRSTPTLSGVFGGTGDPDGDGEFVNLTNSENWATGFTHTPHQCNAIVALFPSGLPRWVRYSQSAVGGGLGRVPRAPRGIVCAVQDPGSASGFVSGIRLPAFGSAQHSGVVLGVMNTNAAGTAFAGCTTQDGWTCTSDPRTRVCDLAAGQVNTWNMVAASGQYPAAAKMLRLTVGVQLNTVDERGAIFFELKDAAGVGICQLGRFHYAAGASAVEVVFCVVEVPLPARAHFYDSAGLDWKLVATVTGASTPTAGSNFTIDGWQLGP